MLELDAGCPTWMPRDWDGLAGGSRAVRPKLTTLIPLAALLAVAGAWHHHEGGKRRDRLIEATRLARMRIHSEIRLRSALFDADLTENGWVRGVEPSWFAPRPRNPFLPESGRAWLEIDHDADDRMKRPDSIGAGPDDAAWWYNPMNGAVCARVPMQSSAERTNALHRAVND